MALYTIRSMFTYFKNYEPTTSTHRGLHHQFKESDKFPAERFDFLMTKFVKTFNPKARRNSQEEVEVEKLKEMQPFKKQNFLLTTRNQKNFHLETSGNFLDQCVPKRIINSL